jgi:hypothetical protein
VIPPNLAKEKGRVNIRQVHLPRAFKIAFAELEILRHHAEINVSGAENMTHLPQHFLHAHVAPCVACAVVPREEEFQFLAGCPRLAQAQHPTEAPHLDQRANPRNQKKIGHAFALPTTIFFTPASAAGHGFAG